MIDQPDTILSALPEAVIGVSRWHQIVYANAAAEQTFGRPAGAIVGCPLDTLLPAASRARHAALADGFWQSETPAKMMHERRKVSGARGDGSSFPAEVTLVKGAWQGQAVVFAIVRDMTEQQRREAALAASERKFRAIIEASPEPILVADAESGRLIEANEAAARLFDCRRGELIGLHQTELHPLQTRERFRRTFREHIESGRVTVPDAQILTAGGQEIQVEISASPVVVEDGLHVVGFFRDMTRQIAHERSLRLALDEANASITAKKMFLANMTHELRTPLNGIIGFSELIAREIHGPIATTSYREYGEIIHSSGLHLLSIVNDLLDLSQIELDKVELAEESLEVAEIVTECRRMLEVPLASGGVRFASAVPPGFALLADRRALKQMLLNLMSNALKFTDPGGLILVEARVDSGVDAEGSAAISVTDNGAGIAPERLASVTEPFASSGNIYTRQKGGAGIGLSITKGLIERHGGRLEIESAPGRGTIARLIFPEARLGLSRRGADYASAGARAATKAG